jgi:hypothetical protein
MWFSVLVGSLDYIYELWVVIWRGLVWNWAPNGALIKEIGYELVWNVKGGLEESLK